MGDYRNILQRNFGTISQAEQRKLEKAKIAIIGFGGVGQAAFSNLLRLGVGGFSICDPDEFEVSNMNRQAFCTLESLGEGKAEAGKKFAGKINPQAEIRAFAEEFSGKNSGKILSGCTLAIDGLDNYHSREILHSECMSLEISWVFASALGSQGMCGVFEPWGKAVPFKKIFGRAGKFARKCDSIIAPAAYMAGTLAASQAALAILGKPFVKAPDFLFFDVFSKEASTARRLG